MGGGTILIALLSIFNGMNQHQAQGINVIFFICYSITSIIFNSKNKNINWKIVKIICPFGIVGAILGAIISVNLDTNILKRLFGIFLCFIVIYEIVEFKKLNKNKEKSNNKCMKI